MKKYLSLFIFILFVFSVKAQNKYYRSITIDRTKVLGVNQTNFPVLISLQNPYLKTVGNGGKVNNVNGYDIMFTSDIAAANKLNWEIEKYDATTGELIAWVKLDISSGSDKVIYMHYGDISISTFQGNITGTWNTSYNSVYHLRNGVSLNASDATTNANNGLISGATATTGQINGGANLTGAPQYINIGNSGLVGITGDMTIEAWIKPTDFSNFNGILSKTAGAQPKPYDFYLIQGSGIPNFFRGNGTGSNSNVVASAAPIAGVWSHLAIVVSGNTVTHYLNGILNGTGTLASSGIPANSTENAYIGTRGDFVTRFKGSIDEVRLSQTALSSQWIQTGYNNQSSPSTFYALGTEIIAGNQSPTANAGINQTIKLPTTSVMLNGSGTDVDGTIEGYSWTRISGPNTPTILNPSSASTNVSGLILGSYVFRLTVTDNLGAVGTADITITVDPENFPPTANAGANQNVTVPASTATLNGSGTDVDGNIASYSWTRISGPNTPAILNPSSPSTNVSGLIEGTYVFRLTVTDNFGASAISDVQVFVSPAPVAGIYFRSLTIDRTKISGSAHTNFPVLISGIYPFLKTIPNGGKVNNINGFDILFSSDSAGTNKLNWELEKYNGTTGELIAWVKLDVSSSTDKVIYLQYGDPSFTTFQGNKIATWNSSFNSVYHLSNGTVLNASDATTNANNGIINSATAVTGKIDGAASLAGGSQNINVGSSNLVGITGNMTIEAWINPTDFSNFNGILSKTAGNQPKPYDFYLTQGNGVPNFFRGNGAGANSNVSASSAPSAGTWSHIAVTVSGNTVTHYLNGVVNGSGNLTGSGTPVNGTDNAYIGTRGDFATRFKGNIDEIRISQVSLSSDWIKTEYNNQTSPSTFYSVGAEKSSGTQAPIANAGPNQSISLPASSVILGGTGFANNGGSITSYMWTRISGPNTPTIVSPNQDTTNVTGLVLGVYVFQLTVTDNNAATGVSNVTITVDQMNQPPVANAGTNQSITIPASSVTLSGSGNDPDGTIASYNWVRFSGPNIPVITSSNSATTNVTSLIQGTYIFRLTVTDNLGANASSDVIVTVKGDITPPVVTTNTLQTVVAGGSLSLSSSANSTFPITYTKWSKFSAPNQSNKRVTVIGSSTSAGNGLPIDSIYVSRLKNYYKDQGIIDTIYNLSVSGTSVFDAQITTALNKGAKVLLVNYPSNAYGGNTYSVTAICTKYQEIADSCVARGVEFYTTGTQPREDYNATDRTKLNIINDSLKNRFGARLIDFMTPVLNTYDNSIKIEYTQGDGIHLNGTGHDRFFEIVKASNIFQNTFSSASNINSPNSGSTLITGLTEPGNHKFQISIKDARGLAATAIAEIQINPLNAPNAPPVANAGLDKIITLPANSVSLDGSASTDDHTIVSYQWTKLTGIEGTLTTPNASTTNFTGLTAGVYTVELKVTDDSTAVGMDTIQIIVNPPLNQPPVANAGIDKIITLPVNSISLNGSASTDDHNIVAYQWIKLTGTGGTLATPTAAITNFAGLTAGIYTLELRVTDDSSAVSKDTIMVTVNNALNQPPVANAGADEIITLPVNSVNLNGSASTDDYNIVSYQWTKLTGIGGALSTPTAVSTNFTGLTAGSYTVELRITDDSSSISRDTVMITVNPPVNQPPVANAGPDQAIYVPINSVLLSGSASTDDHHIVSYQWTKLTGIGGSISTPNVVSTNFTGLSVGTYTVELRVTDDSSAVSRDTVKIIVNQYPPNTPPIANAGLDQSLVYPINSAILNGSGSTDDHNIVAYQWTKLSGTGGTLSTPNAVTTNFNGLIPGIYTVELRVTDDSSAISRDTIQITINQGSVLDPNDPVITYDPNNSPTEPPFGQIGKWVRTVRLNWNTTSFKPYIYKGVAFRLKFPKTYNPAANDGKKYPILIFFHGLGETGVIYDNEYQMYHGGQQFNNAVDNGTFDGYVIMMQSQGFFGGGHYAYLKEIIDYMVEYNKLDPFKVITNGLSAGGQGTWEMFLNYPTYVTAAIPMSHCQVAFKDNPYKSIIKYMPVWNFHGGADNSPAVSTCYQVRDAILAEGGNYTNTMYPTLGHGVWNTAWDEPDFWPYVNRYYKSDPWPLFGRTEFCPGETYNVTLALMTGFNNYEWRKNGVLIPGANANSITVNQPGIYSARILRGSLWSDWSKTPVEIKTKTPTITPPITVYGLMSKVLPALDTPRVTLQVPPGYESYVWKNSADTNITISTSNLLNVASPGNYIVRVTEQFGCSSSFSNGFTVINANGPNKPSAPASLLATTLSKTSLRLDWSDDPSPAYNETGFEIYQGDKTGGPYKLINITGADVNTFTVNNLHPNVTYFYKVRSVNNTAASAASNEAYGKTDNDNQAPTAPTNLTITNVTLNSISLSWTAATDDVGVVAYDVYINDQKSFITTQTQFTVYPLTRGTTYTFKIKAKDFAGNLSPASNQVTGTPALNGLNYKYYTFTGTWSNLPDFSTLTPNITGNMANVAITPRTQNDNFAFLWEGYISIPTTGTYYFRTNSDDGSRLWLGTLNGAGSPYTFSGSPVVNNDGLHGGQDATSVALSLTAGVYPFAAAFYEQGGGEVMTVSWRTPASGTNYVVIPNSAFTEGVITNGTMPMDPSNLVAKATSYKNINLAWNDNSDNETGFEIWRSTNSTTGFSTIGTAAANATIYSDSVQLTANTQYYYKIRAIGSYGESQLVDNINFTEASWKLNNNYTDGSGNGRTITASGSPSFDASNKMEGSHSLLLNGTSQYTTMPTTGSFLQTAYDQKSIAFWMRSNSNTGSRVVADIGGNDDGLALLLNSSTLIAAVASNNVRQNISTGYSSTGWNHIVLVYNKNSLKLYVNGNQVAANNSLSFNSIGTTTNGSRIGRVNGTNAYNSGTGYFSGWIDNFSIFSKALSLSDIDSLMTNQNPGQSFASTLALPGVPQNPTNLLASSKNANSIQITWADNSSNETNFELYRSNNNNTNYQLLTTLSANTISYTDTGLFSHAIYYYKIRTIGAGGNSSFSNEDSAKAGNNKPVIQQLVNRSARYGVSTNISINATDTDGDQLTFSILNQPAFATFTDNGNNSANLVLNPVSADQGVYNNIRIITSDLFGGKDTTQFNLTVNNNYDPSLTSISNYTINEGDSITVNLQASDQNATDVLTWSVTNLPSVFTLSPPTGSNATLGIRPGYASAGIYNVIITVNDGNGGVATRQFILTVNDKDPNQKIYIGFDTPAGTPWNSLTTPTFNNLKDSHDNLTGIGININTNSWIVGYLGPQTGNNSGIYPDNVIRQFHYFGLPWQSQTANGVISGLDPNRKYNFTFYGGSIWDVAPDNGNTNYTIGGETKSLYVQNNTQNTVTLSNKLPDANGNITFSVSKGAGATVGYLNAVVISYIYDDATAPATPSNLSASYFSGQGTLLNWKDVAYNETAYEVYRALSSNGTYILVGTISQINSETFIDGTASGNTTYYYKVRAINGYGASPYSNIANVNTPNRVPQLTPIANVILKNDQTLIIPVNANDDPTDNIVLAASGLPSFASLVDNGNGTGTININPTLGSIGTYNGITLTATDNIGATSTISFNITIIDKDISSVYVNFSDGINKGSLPWNNMSNWPVAGSSLINLLNDSDLPSGISLTLLDNFEGLFNRGMNPGNGKTIYDESVMRTAYFESTTNSRRIKISGLTNTKKYNFVFFNSHDFDLKTVTNFTINGQTVSLDATYNSNKSIQINGISPDVNGEVVISMAKALGNDLAVWSSLVIQSYNSSLTLLSPTDLRVVNIADNSLKLQWADRAFDETAYQIWRATDGNSFSLLSTVSTNSTSYTDNNLAGNKTYYYTIRAVKNSQYSAYTSNVSATTYYYNVYVNCNSVNDAPLPWNNTAATPELGHAWSNFFDGKNNITSVGMGITKEFSEVHPLGMNTGNNTGVYPDNLLIYSYYVFPGIEGGIKLTGLNLALKYDLTIIGSTQGWGNLNTVYTINGKKYYFNSSLNVGKGSLIIYGLSPDQNGEINLTLERGSNESPGGYLNAFILSGFSPPVNNPPAQPLQQMVMIPIASRTSTTSESQSVEKKMDTLVSPIFDRITVNAFPNPFTNDFTLEVLSDRSEPVFISIYNSSAQLLYNKNYFTSKGANYFKVNNKFSNGGIYFVRFDFIDRKEFKVLKLVKQ